MPEVNPVSPFVVNLVGVLLTGAVGFLGAAYWRARGRADRLADANAELLKSLQEQIAVAQGQLQMLGVAVQPLTAAMAAMLVKSLTHFHSPETDILLAKVGPPTTLTTAEESELGHLMVARSRDVADEIGPLERNAAQLLPLVIERNRLEAGRTTVLLPLLVGVPKGHE